MAQEALINSSGEDFKDSPTRSSNDDGGWHLPLSGIGDFFVQVYRYREYLYQSVQRDLKNKYKRSFFGYLWTMLHPLFMMGILAVVFSHIVRIEIRHYAIFLFAGLLPWNFFNSTAMMSLGSIRANARLFSHVPLPKYLFIVSIACSNLVNLMLAVVPLLVIMLLLHHPLSFTILAAPLVLLPVIMVTLGVSLILAALNVFFDDTLHLAEVGMSALYFLCPVIYHRELLPAWLLDYLVLNPVFSQIENFRAVFYDGVFPDPYWFGVNVAASLLVLGLGLAFFQRLEKRFLYYI